MLSSSGDAAKPVGKCGTFRRLLGRGGLPAAWCPLEHRVNTQSANLTESEVPRDRGYIASCRRSALRRLQDYDSLRLGQTEAEGVGVHHHGLVPSAEVHGSHVSTANLTESEVPRDRGYIASIIPAIRCRSVRSSWRCFTIVASRAPAS